MAGAPIVVPFDHNPEATSVKTGAYVIPVGKYAFVEVFIESGGSFTIDGTEALSLPVVGSVVVNFPTGATTYTVPDGVTFVGSSAYGGAIIKMDVSGTLYAVPGSGTETTSDIFELASGAVVSFPSATGFDVGAITGALRPVTHAISHTFKVPTGASLNSTGAASYTVAEYNQKT